MKFIFASLLLAFSVASHAVESVKAFCFSLDVGDGEVQSFELTKDVTRLGKIPGKNGLEINYSVTYFVNDSNNPALMTLFSVTKNGELIMASTDAFTKDGETSVTADAAHPVIQHALATNPEFKSINDVYASGLVPEDEPFWVLLGCSIYAQRR